jgi:glycerophosphoryl diester phosphodiesterase
VVAPVRSASRRRPRPPWLHTVPIAHRGLHDAEFPENTLGAFDAAASAGYAMELDVRLSSDNELVVFHDATTARLTDEDHVVSETEARVLTALTVANSRYKIPLLAEAFEVVAGRSPVLVDVKPDLPVHRLGPALVAAISHYGGPVAVQSIDPRVLWWLRRNAPHIVRGQLSGAFPGVPMPIVQRFAMRTMAANVLTAPQFIAYDIESLPSGYVRMWRAVLRAPLLGWTIRNEDGLKLSEHHGANPIFDTIRPLSESGAAQP